MLFRSDDHPFVVALRKAVATRGDLPPLSEVPINAQAKKPVPDTAPRPADRPGAAKPAATPSGTGTKSGTGTTFEP